MQPNLTLILASQSPRRAQLLREAGIAFEQRSPPYADPDQPPQGLSGDEAQGYAASLAEMKAISLDQEVVPSLVLAADTICVDDTGQLVGKPRDQTDARQMIRSFTNTEHRVITGVALLRVGEEQSSMEVFADTAVVGFGSIADEQLDKYLTTDDWQGKAGGYNLFDRQAAGWPITVHGDPTTVVGLPMRRLIPLLQALVTLRRMSIRSRALQAMSGEDTSAASVLMRGVMTAAQPFYAAGNALRSAGFAAGVKRTHELGRPTLSVGNLTTGGTGKTPMVGYLVRHLADLGHKPCILMRGYRGGDEAEEHKNLLGDLAYVEPNPDRVGAAKIALGEHPDISCFVLDDGFQHRRAKRDLDLVLIDASNPWGYGRMLPRGLMREPKSALSRADAVILTHCEQADDETLQALDQEIEQITGRPSIAKAEHTWTGLRDDEDSAHPLSAISDFCVMGVVGIGNPDAFTTTLQQHSDRVVHCEALPDHHDYTKQQILKLIDLAMAARADALVTTEKDWVKWSLLLEDEKLIMPIFRAELTMRWRAGEAELAELVQERITSPTRSEAS